MSDCAVPSAQPVSPRWRITPSDKRTGLSHAVRALRFSCRTRESGLLCARIGDAISGVLCRTTKWSEEPRDGEVRIPHSTCHCRTAIERTVIHGSGPSARELTDTSRERSYQRYPENPCPSLTSAPGMGGCRTASRAWGIDQLPLIFKRMSLTGSEPLFTT